MFKFIPMFIMLVTPVFCIANQPLSNQQVQQLITQADSYRLGEESAKVVSKATLYKQGKQDKTRQYTVYTRANRESLVIFNAQVEAGQKMLMLGDNYWLLMPKSRRPIRITPMQKLLGEASIGDISTLTWSEDYQGHWLSEAQLSFVDLDGSKQRTDTHKLRLEAKTKGASYTAITLWLEKETGFPVKADLFLQSGKMAKQAWFTKGMRDGEEKVISMQLDDQIQNQQQTVIEYLLVEPVEIADKYYNPSYLSRTKSLAL
ncbi:outer membrane lipoprotein-sorting protein [Psychromonas sp. psych-6C06]|uniref:outer membrane lipoprotein-sorting protein n=1 Tax=Psychromonas sp. psych-6C06 TaxID=2058089 RepID=UPI000C31CD8B|nr:outer membrane lipoprotein-sorting protein [Psychromonas sp. psych-6C06]PKF63751.1 outer membrane lipoprotein-sorting protein [Psychromonas sp. psych-6C06]